MVDSRKPARVAEVRSRPNAWNAVPAALRKPSSAPARASNKTSRFFAPSELEPRLSFRDRLASSFATERSTSEKGTSAMSMRTAVSSAGDGEASDA